MEREEAGGEEWSVCCGVVWQGGGVRGLWMVRGELAQAEGLHLGEERRDNTARLAATATPLVEICQGA